MKGALLAIAVLAASTAQARTVETCSWDHPGRHRNQLSVEETIERHPSLAPFQREALQQAWRERRIERTVVIDRDSIRASDGTAYAAEIEGMAFGAGDICRRVTRAGWTPEHTETAIVLAGGGVEIAIPAICLNVFLLRPLERRSLITPPIETVGWIEDELPPGGNGQLLPPYTPGVGVPWWGVPGLPGAPGAPGTPGGFGGGGGASFGALFIGGTTIIADCCCELQPSIPGVTAPIPEPSTWLLLLAGVMLVFWRHRRL